MSLPSEVNPHLLASSSGYQISRSVRFRSSASAYFNRTLSTPTNNKIWTFSCWFKRGQLTYGASGAAGALFFAPSSGSTFAGIYFTPTDIINWYDASGGATVYLLQTTQVFRDPSAWYHLVCAYDSTQATASDRQKMYINGSLITALATTSYVAQNTNGRFNSAVSHTLGEMAAGPQYFDGYMTEVNFIDGQALTPASFGVTDSVTGVWNPIRYSGTYGTNGFYLNFSDNSAATAAAIGKDSSGNGNNWTPNNISVTTGATYDSMVDSPTNYGTDTGAGGEVRGNYCTLNPLENPAGFTLSGGNLDLSGSPAWRGTRATIGITSGKWYWEYIHTSATNGGGTGISTQTGYTWSQMATNDMGVYPGGWEYIYTGQKGNNNSYVAYGASFTQNDVVGVAFDADAGTLTFYKNGVSQGTAYTGLTSGPYFPTDGGPFGGVVYNFGQRPFSYTAPSGFKALCTQNLPTPTVNNGAKHMAATTYAGSSGTQSISNAVNGVSFQPDFVWLKNRTDGSTSHSLYNSVVGTAYYLQTNTTDSEFGNNGLSGFNSDGFGLVSNNSWVNLSGKNYVGWQWKGAGTAVTNTNGSITSQVSANPTAGFSVLTYTGTGATATIGHGLGGAPSMMIMKKRSAVGSWKVFHTILGNGKILELNATDGAQTSSTYWNNTSANSTVFTVGTNADINASSETYVAYCWSQITGYSAFTTYTGNGSGDGPFVYCGFRPRWLLIKRYDASGDPWWLVDSTRSSYNQTTLALRPSGSNVEDSGGNANFDFLANGFKARTSGGGNGNESGATYIVAAFAENPFTIARAR